METIMLKDLDFYHQVLSMGVRASGYNSPDGITRYLEHDFIIESFTYHQSAGYNGRNREYFINGNPNHRMWLSQFQYAFLHPSENEELIIIPSFIYTKNKEYISLRSMDYEEFEKRVQGKKFAVSAEYLVAIKEFGDWELIIKNINDAYKNKKHEALKSFVCNKMHYILNEID